MSRSTRTSRWGKGFRVAGLALAGVVAALLLLLASSTYLRRWTLLAYIDVHDFSRLPSRPVAAAPGPVPLEVETTGDWIAPLGVPFGGRALADEEDLARFLEDHATTAFIVLKDGRVLDERYFNGFDRDSYFKSFSVTKSVLSALIGIAISEGVIGGVEDPVSKYLPGIQDARLGRATLQHCLDNTTGIAYSRGVMPWRGQPRMYYTTDVRGLVRASVVAREPGSALVHEDISPLVLGCVLEQALRRRNPDATLAGYLSEKIWRPMGAEFDALWNIDREGDGIEKTESGLCARAVDLARFASLYLHEGRSGEREIVPGNWVRETMAKPSGEARPNTWRDGFLHNLWWGTRIESPGGPDVYANGHFGQRLYISPGNGLVMVRLGYANVGVDWTAFLAAIAEGFDRAGGAPVAGASGAGPG